MIKLQVTVVLQVMEDDATGRHAMSEMTASYCEHSDDDDVLRAMQIVTAAAAALAENVNHRPW